MRRAGYLLLWLLAGYGASGILAELRWWIRRRWDELPPVVRYHALGSHEPGFVCSWCAPDVEGVER